MSRKFITYTIFLISITNLFGAVPQPTTRPPLIPFLMESYQFRPVRLQLFSGDISGMVADPYSDLNWNPVFALDNPALTYIDFNFQNRSISALDYPIDRYGTFEESYVRPSYYYNTSIATAQAAPHYDFAAILPIGEKISIALLNRSLLDYGPYRSSNYRSDYRNTMEAALYTTTQDYELQRLEMEDNQQTIRGTQPVINIGYRLTRQLDLGVRLGFYNFKREGTLYDDKWGYYPHYSFADLTDESLETSGNQLHTGVGLSYRLNPNTRIAGYAGLISGSSTENQTALDTAYYWSERDDDSTYYSKSYSLLDSDHSYEMKGTQPIYTLAFEHRLSEELCLRSNFLYSHQEQDITSVYEASDTSQSDRTYDYYVSSVPHFRRYQAHASRFSDLNGSGATAVKTTKWFASLSYSPVENNLIIFGGILFKHTHETRNYTEFTNYRRHSYSEYSLYNPKSYEYYNRHNSEYQYCYESDHYLLYLPLGFQIPITTELSALIGTALQLALSDYSESGDLLYPSVISRRWEDGNLEVEDIEINRYERFVDDPAKDLNRSNEASLGLRYRHSSGTTFYIVSSYDITNTNTWEIGLEKVW